MTKPFQRGATAFLILFGLSLFLALFTAGCQSKEATTPNVTLANGQSGQRVIKVGTNKTLGTITPYIARAKGFFNQQDLQVEITDFNDGTTMMEAFAQGHLDLAYVGIAPATIFAASKSTPLKVVASANGGGHVIMTREDTHIQKIADLKGKKVGVPKAGSVTDTLFRAKILKDAGLNAESDLTIVTLAPTDMGAALMVARSVDAIVTLEPYAIQTASQFPSAKAIYSAGSEWRKEKKTPNAYPVNMVVANQKFIDQHPEELKRFLKTHKETTEFMNRDLAAANALIAQESNLSPDLVTKAREQVDYTVEIDVPSTMATLEWSNQLGYIPTMPDPNSLFDSAFLPR